MIFLLSKVIRLAAAFRISELTDGLDPSRGKTNSLTRKFRQRHCGFGALGFGFAGWCVMVECAVPPACRMVMWLILTGSLGRFSCGPGVVSRGMRAIFF